MNKNKERVADFKNLCLLLKVRFERVYIEKRTEGAVTVKFYNMRSPNTDACMAMMRKATQLGASKSGFKRSPHLSIFADPMNHWSFVMHFEPEGAPVQQQLFTRERWPGSLAPPPAEEIH